MIRDQETLNLLLDTISRFVRERLVPNEARVRAVAAAVKFLTEKCGLTESYLYDTATGGAELDLETKVQLLAVALCEPAPPHAPGCSSC